MAMKKDAAIAYLERKNEIRSLEDHETQKREKQQNKKADQNLFNKKEKRFYDKDEKIKIKEVMKEGKIYGDPLVITNG